MEITAWPRDRYERLIWPGDVIAKPRTGHRPRLQLQCGTVHDIKIDHEANQVICHVENEEPRSRLGRWTLEKGTNHHVIRVASGKDLPSCERP